MLFRSIAITVAILQLFGNASGLMTNLQKSNILPIACQGLDLAFAVEPIGCQLAQFPCRYLGLPLSDGRLKRNDFQFLLDKFMKKLAGWKAKWISMAGRLTLVNVVLSALPAYQLIAIFHPKWLIRQIDKLRRAFLWSAESSVSGGKCLVNWRTCCLPKQLGGLGIPDLQLQNIAFRVRWLWQQETDPSKPWLGLPLPIDNHVRALFQASTVIHIHDGCTTSFWSSHWLQSWPLKSRFPALFKHSRRRNISVREALTNRAWISLIKINPSLAVLTEYLQLWAILEAEPLFEFDNEADSISWSLTTDSKYSAKSAYKALFFGRISSVIMPQIWKTKAIPKCKLHTWLLFHNKCLTADNLAKRGWPHNPVCPLCNNAPETAIHLHVSCAFSQTVWTKLLADLHLPGALCPSLTANNLRRCWSAVNTIVVPALLIKRWKSLAMLTWWSLWKERNNRIFRNKSRLPNEVAEHIILELNQWRAAGILITVWPAGA